MHPEQQNRQSMSRLVATATVLVAVVVVWAGAAAPTAEFSIQTTQADINWYKGNTHAHTLNSDGDSTPDVAMAMVGHKTESV